MNTNEQAQTVVEYVRVNSRQPQISVSLNNDSGQAAEFNPEEGHKVFFNKDWDHTLYNGDVVSLNLKVIDIDEGDGDYITAIGGDVRDHKVDGFTQDCSLDVFFPAPLHMLLKHESNIPSFLRNVSLLIKTPDLGRIIRDHDRDRRPTERIRDRSDREREAVDSIQELLCSHLDDIIAQANVLKTADQPLVKSDAYARIRFAMARLESLEQTSTYDVRPRYMSREKASEADRRQREQRRENRYRREHGQLGFDVDRVYRQSTDSYYTPDGQFIETSDEAHAKAWYGDASPESMERLRRDREIAERERELNPLNDRDPRGYFRDDRREDRDDRRGGRRG